MITVAIIAAVRIYRDGLAAALDATPGISVLGTAADWSEVSGRLLSPAPDVLVVDVAHEPTAGGLRLVSRISPGVRVVAVSLSDDDHAALACLEAGISAYVLRGAPLDDLVSTIERTVRGELHCSPRFAAALGRRMADLAALQGRGDRVSRLTSRELEIVYLIERELSNREIASRLCIEVATVKNHVHSILSKLQVRRRSEAADWARSVGNRSGAASAHGQLTLGDGHPFAG
jgi:two-component system, NarL family, nitrate/nitrite response regulator NarL